MNAFEWRVAIAVAISIGVVWFLHSWTAPEVPARPEVVAGTYVSQAEKWGPDALTYAWYGPALLMLIPGMFFWIGFNTDSRDNAVICIGFGLVLILIFGFVIWHANSPMVFSHAPRTEECASSLAQSCFGIHCGEFECVV